MTAIFSISCTTCRKRLRVRDESAVGQIHTCPRCGSMVLVQAPSAAQGGQQGPLAVADSQATSCSSSSPPDAPPAAAEARVSPPAAGAAPILPSSEWISQAAQQGRQWLLIGGAAMSGAVLAVGLFGFMIYRSSETPPGRAPGSPDERLAGEYPPGAALGRDRLSPAIAEQAAPRTERERPALDSRAPPPDVAFPLADAGPVRPAQPAIPPGSPRSDETRERVGSLGPLAQAVEPIEPGAYESPPGFTPRAVDEEAVAKLTDAPAVLSDRLSRFSPLIGDAPFDLTPPTDSLSELPLESSSTGRRIDAASRPRPEPRRVNVAARLSDRIEEIEFGEAPLADFLQFVSQLSTIPITLDPDVLAPLKLTPQTAVSVKQRDTTVGGVLSAALYPLGLDYTSGGDLLTVGRSAAVVDAVLRQAVHPVSDLTSDDPERLKRLGEWIVELVAPQSWDESGGRGVLRYYEQSLIIEHDEAVQFQVLLLCEKLRVARGLSPRSSYPASMFELTPRWKRPEQKLSSPITISYTRPTQMARVLDQLGKAAGLQVLVDWAAAGKIGWSPDAEITFSANRQPLGEALQSLLQPMGLAYRVVDENTLQVTTPQSLEGRLELELYPVGDLLANGADAPRLVQRIKTELGEPLFDEQEGRGALGFDAKSACLLAALPQPQQIALANLLTEWRRSLRR